MKNRSPSHRPDLALQASREAAQQITTERREGVPNCSSVMVTYRSMTLCLPPRCGCWHGEESDETHFYARKRGHPNCVLAARSCLAPILLADEAEKPCPMTHA